MSRVPGPQPSPSAVDSLFFASLMTTLPKALGTLLITFITELIARANGQTTCAPLMQALVQQAEATNSFGSWDACCARTGIDCFLSRQAVPPGTEPCDVAHSARAGCNRLAQGTVCMIGGDGLVSGSPCGASIIRTCGSVIARGGGVATPFAPPSGLGTTSASILAGGVLDSQLCCSTSVCTFTSSCTSQYNMNACISDGVNFICIPLDQPDDTTYAAQIVQDGHNCMATSSTNSSSPTSTTSTAGGAVPTQDDNKGGGNTAIIGGSVGGAVGFACIAILSIILCMRNRRRGPITRNVPSNELPGHEGPAATTHVSLFPNLPGSQSTSGYTPSLLSHPGPQWTSAIGTLPSFTGPSHQNQNTSEYLANPQAQNPSQVHGVHQDPQANIITRPFHRNTLEFPANLSQVYQGPSASIISGPTFQPPASPPPFQTTDFPSSLLDTQAMEARIVELENRIQALSGPSSRVQVRRSGRGGAAEAEEEPPRYDDKV